MYKKIGNVVWKVKEESFKGNVEKIFHAYTSMLKQILAKESLVPEEVKLTEEEKEQKLRYIPGKK